MKQTTTGIDPNDATKPREFWIDRVREGFTSCHTTDVDPTTDDQGWTWDDAIKVIEYSAYERLKNHYDLQVKCFESMTDERDRLKAALKVADEALTQWHISYEMGRAPYNKNENPAAVAIDKIETLLRE